MKKTILFLSLILPVLAFGQNTVTLPTPTTSYTPQFRYYGAANDSLKRVFIYSGTSYNEWYTATKINQLLKTPNSVFTKRTDSLFNLSAKLTGNNTFTGDQTFNGNIGFTTGQGGSFTTNNLHVGTGVGGANIDFISAGAFPYPFNWKVGNTIGTLNNPFYIRYRSTDIVRIDTFNRVFIDTLKDNSGRYYLKTGSVPDSTTISNAYVAKLPSGFGANITGAGGNGYIDLTSQSASPTSLTNHLKIYSDSLNRFSWKNSNYRRTIRVTRAMDQTISTPYRLNPILADSTDVADTYKQKSDSTASTGYQTVGNFFPKGDTRYVKLSGSTSTGMQTVQLTTEQLRLGYDVSNYTSFTTGSTGNLTILPTGGTVIMNVPLRNNNISNTTSANNSQILFNTGGTSILRNVADANAALTVTQTNASSTGNILNVANSAGNVFTIAKTGTTILNVSSTGTTEMDVVNSNAGTASDARIIASNGTSSIGLIMRGTGFTGNPNVGLINIGGTARAGISLNGTERITFTTTGNLGIGLTGPTAYLNIKAGTATAGTAPLKFITGVNLTTPEAGSVEYDGTDMTLTNSTVIRYTLLKGLSASSTLDFTSTAAQTSSELTITVTGAADGDIVSVGVPNASSSANSCFTARVSATNTVSVKFNNYSSGAIDPASGTFKVTVFK